ncbi:MAG: LamG-like jellyroll fold domain-containing protein [Planctomycetia bacterium]|nr:LamG-like jellyroll fold domain-containing protein [Planctomycetia bacterium]
MLFLCDVSQAGMLANWNFDDETLADSSGNGMDLTPTPYYRNESEKYDYDNGSFSYIANGGGSALSADGDISAYVDFGNAATLNSFTVSMWADVTPQGWDNYWTILGSSSTTRNDGNQGIRFQSRGATSTSAAIYSSITSFSGNGDLPLTDSGSYNHLVLSVANGKGTIYCNGTSIATLSNCTSTRMVGLFSLAGSAFHGSGAPRTMLGNFDNVAVYNRGLTAAEVGILNTAGSATSDVYADIYSREVSGTEGTWSQSVWSHRFGESGTATAANQAWTNYSQAKLSGSGTIAVDENVFISQLTVTTEAGDLTINGPLTLDQNATLTLEENTISMEGLATFSPSHILWNVDADGNATQLQLLETATLGEGVLDFAFDGNFAEILGHSTLDILQAESLVAENVNLLLAESWRGKLELSLLNVPEVGGILRMNVSSAYVPEPSAWLLGLLGVLGGVWLRRRK